MCVPAGMVFFPQFRVTDRLAVKLATPTDDLVSPKFWHVFVRPALQVSKTPVSALLPRHKESGEADRGSEKEGKEYSERSHGTL